MSAWKRCKDLLYFGPRLFLVGGFMLLLVAMALSNFDVLEPYLFPLHYAQGKVIHYGTNVTIGHYPQGYHLERLQKKHGVDLNISLLDVDLPQEKALNAQVAQAAQKLGIEFKSVPLGYLSLEGAENKRKIADIVALVRANPTRKVYIHCYLGRHRVKAVCNELIRQGLIREPGVEE